MRYVDILCRTDIACIILTLSLIQYVFSLNYYIKLGTKYLTAIYSSSQSVLEPQ